MRVALLLFTFSTLLFTACGSKHYWSATPAQGDGVHVDPMQAWVGGGKLWVRATVFNGGSLPVRVVRDEVACVLPGGQRIGRAAGATSLHNTYAIPPGESHAVYVEFEAEGFDWDGVPSVTVDFSKAIYRGEQPVNVAPMTITNSHGGG
jgi:hypothetical protein